MSGFMIRLRSCSVSLFLLGSICLISPTLAHSKEQLKSGVTSDDTTITLIQIAQAIGKAFGFGFIAKADESTQGLISSVIGIFLGKERSLINMHVKPDNDMLDNGEALIYIGGIQVIGPKFTMQNGALKAEMSIPPVISRVPVAAYPIGPLMLKLDAGFALDAGITAAIIPDFAIPVELGAVRVELIPRVQVMAFAEGHVNYFAIRGGVGGQVALIDSDAELRVRFHFNGTKPLFMASGYMNFFNGSFYAFADYFNIFKRRWHRFWNPTLSTWRGYCFDFKNKPYGGKCANQ